MKPLFALMFSALLMPQAFSEKLLEVKEHTLKNGLKILIAEDHHAPLCVCRLYYKVGSVNENPGKTGLSHMLEHMMFKGTERIGVKDFAREQGIARVIDSLFGVFDGARDRGDTALSKKVRAEAAALAEKQRAFLKNNELWSLYQKEGGTDLNAYTSDYVTAYIVTLPSNKIELFFFLESDRMEHPVMREFYTERDVVMEERRLRYENSPYGRYNESLQAALFESHPLRNPTIGTMSDLMHLKKEEAFRHFRTYYVPNNAVLVLAGDVDEKEVLALAEKYFGRVARSAEPPPVTAQEPPPVGLKRIVVKKDVAPVLDILVKTPELGEKDVYGLDIIEGVLNGPSGRLHKTLVKEKKLCTSVSAGNYVSKYYGMFMVHADLMQGVSHEKVENIIFNELDRLKKERISERELEKVKNRVTASEINGLRSNERLADRLAFYEIIRSWKLVNTFAGEVRKVSREDVMALAARYFTPEKCTIGWLIQEKEGGVQ